MVSTKQAMVASDHAPDLEASIFYMDIRAHGKDFDQYYERARSSGNISLYQEHAVARPAGAGHKRPARAVLCR